MSARVQKVAAGALGVSFMAAFAAASGLIWQQERLSRQAQQLDAVESAYTQLRAEVDVLHRETDALVQGIDLDGALAKPEDETRGETPADLLEALRRDLAVLAVRNHSLAERLAEAEADVRGTDERSAELAQSRAALEEALARTKNSLARAVERREELEARFAAAQADLTAARAARRAEANERLKTVAEADRLAAEVDATQEREAALADKLAELERRAAESGAERAEMLRERRRLVARLGHLERALDQASEAQGDGDPAARVADLDEALRAAERRGDRLAVERRRLKGQVRELTARLAEKREQQSGLFAHFTERTRHSLERIEATVEMTGLDVDDLVHRVQSEEHGRGGPFVPVDAELDVEGEALRLGEQMERMAALQAALAALPLTAPVDSYWISSYFGKRHDPINGQWAQHQGVDFAAQEKAPVLAAAPGKVVFSGTRGGFGRLVEIDHGYGITTYYAHLQSIAVEAGDQVTHREKIGELGSSGRSTGPHLHYEIRVDDAPVDPMNFLKAGRYVFKG